MGIGARVLSISALALLGSCGGGGGGDPSGVGVVAGSPTPAPSTPAPTPTPTPTPVSITSSVATAQFLTVTGSTRNLTGGSTSNRSVTGVNPNFSFSIDGAGRYTIQNEQRSQTFGPTISNQTSLPDYFPRTEYQVTSAGGTDYLVLFKQANATPSIPTNYSAYGAWQHNTAIASGATVRLDYFTYGTPTTISAMPHTGTATYRFFGTGNYADDTKLYFDQSYSTMTVDFTTGQVSTNFGLTGSDFLSGSFGGLLGMSFMGKISGNSVDGPLTFTNASYSGIAHVQFYGPNANDIGITYSGFSPFAGSFNGALVGTTP